MMMMNKFVLAVLLIASGSLVSGGRASDADVDASDIDVLRAHFIDLENDLAGTIDNGVDQTSVARHIFHEFRKFVNSNLTQEFIGNNYDFMENVYEWKLLESDLLVVNNLFSLFRQLLAKDFDAINKLEFTDFAETVLMDQKLAVNSTFEKITNVMINQGLYYKVILVRAASIAACFSFFALSPFSATLIALFCSRISRKRRPKYARPGNRHSKCFTNSTTRFPSRKSRATR